MLIRIFSLSFLLVAATAQNQPRPIQSVKRNDVVPNSYIVKLKEDAPLSISERDIDYHARFYKRASGEIQYSVTTEYKNPDLFYGIAITVKDNLTIEAVQEKLSSLPEVVGVWPNYIVKAPRPFGTPELNSTSNVNKASAEATRWNGTFPVASLGPDFDASSALKMGGVDQVHALGIKGKGVKIAIIDTGVDYRHPSLGGGFGPGFKIEKGYAFVDDMWIPGLDPVESPDPLVTCFDGGHGTHVTGIIGMQDPEGVGFGIVGVAPEASIFMYRVFSCPGASTTEIIIRAMELAATDGATIISMSLGQTEPFQESDPYSITSTKLASLGIAVIAAAGNDGDRGLHFTSAPSIGENSISVASIANSNFPTIYTGKDSFDQEFKYASVWPIQTNQPLDIFILDSSNPLGCSFDAYEDAVSKIDRNTTIFAISTECLAGYFIYMYYDFRYVAFLSANGDPVANEYIIMPRTDLDQDHFLDVDASNSAMIRALYAQAGGYGNYKLTFESKVAASPPQVLGGLMSNYSTFGPPVDTMAQKPQLAAPGGNILSAWPLGYLGGYTVISGTSMATPYVAACYALVKQRYPTLSITEIKALLQTTSVPASYPGDKSILSSAVHQGSGLINVYQAITSEVSISPSELSVGDTDAFLNAPRNITITNKSNTQKTFILSHQGAGYAELSPYPDLLDPYIYYAYGQPQYAKYGSAKFSDNSIILGSGQSASIQVNFSPPEGMDFAAIAKNPIQSGYIKITNDEDHFVVPYTGVPYSRFSANFFDTTEISGSPFPMRTLTRYSPEIGYNLGLASYDRNLFELPYFVMNFLHLSANARMDVLPANTTFKPDYYGYDNSIQFDIQSNPYPLASSFLGTPTYGLIQNYTQEQLWPPSKTWLSWYNDSVFTEDGAELRLVNGDFRVLISILRWGGDATVRESWSTFLSPIIRNYESTPTDPQ